MLKLSSTFTNQLKKIQSFCITIIRAIPGFSETREIITPQTRDKNRDTATPIPAEPAPLGTTNDDQAANTVSPVLSINDATLCPYCTSNNFVKRGKRQKKHETVQLYLCRDCHRTFTAQAVKGRRFPLTVILEAITLYNLGYTQKQVSILINQKYHVHPEPSTISDWITFYEPLCRYYRLRPFVMKQYDKTNLVEVTTMAHRQIYRYRYHRGKMNLLLQELKHFRLNPLRDFLETVSSDTPHQYFQDGLRISEVQSSFNKAQLIVKGKHNYANRLAELILPTVRNNQERHEAVQRFMLANDSVTVATEVPVYITQESIEHLENQLNFKVLTDNGLKIKGRRNKYQGRILLTGHIDLLQVRNGVIHILDYKPQAHRVKPVEQLTWYALALSRLTGLRLFDFKCAWFDEKEYFEFYPLHVVYKLKNKRRRKTVRYLSGERVSIPQEDTLTVVH